MHTALPLEQSTTPFLHAALGFVVHAAPGLHALQKPPLQTPPMHVVPFGFALPSPQTGAPVPHPITPFLQSDVGFIVHAAPAVQGLQAPVRHAPPGQDVPFGLFAPS